MMTVISEMTIKSGQEPAWDQAYRERFEDVPNRAGWISVQLLIPLEAPNKRVIVGTWLSRADWEAWHSTDVFIRTRERMKGLTQSEREERWFEVESMEATQV